MSRRNTNRVSEMLGVVLGNPACTLKGWVAVARPVNIDVPDDVADLILKRPSVSSISVYNLGPDLDMVDHVTYASLASGYTFGKIDTLIALNVFTSTDNHRRRSAICRLAQVLKPDGVAYIVRADGRSRGKVIARHFTDEEFQAELKGYFDNMTVITSENPRYPILKCGGVPPI